MTFQEIENKKLSDLIDEIILSYVDTSLVPEGENPYLIQAGYINDDAKSEDENFYLSLTPHTNVIWPDYSLIPSMIESVKLSMESEKVSAFHERVINSGIWSSALLGLGYWQAGDSVNPNEILMSLLVRKNDAEYTQLEDELTRIEAIASESNAKKQRENLGKLAVEMCQRAINVVAGYNITNNLTSAQKDQLESDFATIFDRLSKFRPAQARVLIEAVVVDGVLVTQEMKDELLEVLDLSKFA